MSKQRQFAKVLFYLILPLPCGILASAQGPHEILWLDAERTRPYVIPETAFSQLDWSSPETTDLSSLPLTQEQAANLRKRLARRQRLLSATSDRQDCASLPIGDSFGLSDPPPGTQKLSDLIRAAEISLSGRVVRLMPTWNPAAGRPYTRVFVRPDEILKSSSGRLEPDQEITYLLPYGTISFGQVRECIALPENAYSPREGDRLLFLGWRDPVNHQNFYIKAFFEIRDGKVIPGAHASLRDHSPVSLSDLKKDLQRQLGSEE